MNRSEMTLSDWRRGLRGSVLLAAAVALVPSSFALGCSAVPAGERTASGAGALTKGVPGDVDGTGLADIVLTSGGPNWNTIPVAFSNGDGTFKVTNQAAPNFAAYSIQDNAKPISGDFDGDGLSDLALTGGAGWNTLPVAFSNGDGTYRVTNDSIAAFATYAAQPGARPVVGDFDKDGRSDIALVGGIGWSTIPIAFSNGDGTFRVTNDPVAGFPTYATQGAQVVAADFNHDNMTDLALTGGWAQNVPWSTIPVAFSNGDGTFRVTNDPVANFPTYATQGALAVAGDFDGDHYGDIALTGGTNASTQNPWDSIPIAFSNGDGTFRVTNTPVSLFGTYATQGAQVVAGDFDGNGKSDLALTGGTIPSSRQPWNSIPVAFSNGDGSFRVTNDKVPGFPTWATQDVLGESYSYGATALSASQASRPLLLLVIN